MINLDPLKNQKPTRNCDCATKVGTEALNPYWRCGCQKPQVPKPVPTDYGTSREYLI